MWRKRHGLISFDFIVSLPFAAPAATRWNVNHQNCCCLNSLSRSSHSISSLLFLIKNFFFFSFVSPDILQLLTWFLRTTTIVLFSSFFYFVFIHLIFLMNESPKGSQSGEYTRSEFFLLFFNEMKTTSRLVEFVRVKIIIITQKLPPNWLSILIHVFVLLVALPWRISNRALYYLGTTHSFFFWTVQSFSSPLFFFMTSWLWDSQSWLFFIICVYSTRSWVL